jgi:N-acyl-D-aspartate/D-glutamate deacylase
LRARASGPATRERLLADMRENLRRRNGPQSLLLTSGRPEWKGRTLEEIAKAQGAEPVVAALFMILNGGGSVASFNMLEKRVISLETMIQRSSSATAAALGIADRGLIREGAFADVIVFDPARVRDRSTYEQPELLAEGMQWVFVNGVAAVDGGKLTDRRAGRGIRRAAT